MCERTVAEYRGELFPTTEENERQRTDVQQPPHIKEEEEELWIPQEEADLSKFPLTVVSVKTEEHEDKPPESSQLHHSPSVREEQLLPEQKEWSLSIEQRLTPYLKERKEGAADPPHFKEEEEEHSISQEGENPEWLEEFPLLRIIVKGENDEVKGESEKRGGVEPPSSSSTQHMTTEADGDHCGGSQADKLLAPLSDSEDTTSHSPDTDDEDSKDDKTCHTDNKRFQCSLCDKTFNDRSNFRRHLRSHTGEKKWSCSICGKGFGQSHNLKLHMSVHTGEKPFSCSECGKSFARKGRLNQHMRIHTEEEHCICSVCGKGFRRSPSLKRHIISHTGKKRFTCSVCGKGFVQSQNLKIHIRTHTGEKPFICSICGKGCVTSQHLKLHVRTHTGEKPYSCLFCNKSFCDRSYLQVHLRIHTGEKVLSCSVCGERFSYKYQCKKHKCAGENSSSK